MSVVSSSIHRGEEGGGGKQSTSQVLTGRGRGTLALLTRRHPAKPCCRVRCEICRYCETMATSGGSGEEGS